MVESPTAILQVPPGLMDCLTVQRLQLPGMARQRHEVVRRNLRLVVPDGGEAPANREVFVASVALGLDAVAPSRESRLRNWLELLGHWVEAAPEAVLQVRYHGGSGKAPRVELLVHGVADTPERAANAVHRGHDDLAQFWSLLGDNLVWSPVRSTLDAYRLPFDDRGNLIELFAREEPSDTGQWSYRAFRCMVSDIADRGLPWQWPNGAPFVFAASLRAVEPTPAECKAIAAAGEPMRDDDRKVFEVRLHLASDRPLPDMAVQVFAQRLLGRSGTTKVLDHSAADPSNWRRGGFVAHRPVTPDQVQIARANLLFGAMQPWEPSTAPADLQRARRLVPALPAITVFPAPSTQGLGVAVPVPERMPPEKGIELGEVGVRHTRRAVTQSDADAALHTYVVGKTGTGKSTLLLNLTMGRIRDGHGVAVIDPHGDLALDVIARVPRDRLQDVILFDPSDLEYPIGINLLDWDPENSATQTFLINELLAMIGDLWDLKEVGGPIFEKMFRNGLLALMDTPGTTIAEFSQFMTDKEYRNGVLKRCKNPRVRAAFEDEMLLISGEHSFQNLSIYVTSKLDVFVGDQYILPIVSQPKTALDFQEILDKGKILIVRLNKGQIGNVASRMHAMVIMARILAATLGRSDRPHSDRRPYHVIVDEFHNVMTHSMVSMLSEARKYGLRLTMAHQHVAQLRDDLRAAVIGNVGTTIGFRVGPDDARLLAQAACEPELLTMLPGLPNYHAVMRATSNGEQLPPFVCRTLAAPAPAAADNLTQVQIQSRALAARRSRRKG